VKHVLALLPLQLSQKVFKKLVWIIMFILDPLQEGLPPKNKQVALEKE